MYRPPAREVMDDIAVHVYDDPLTPHGWGAEIALRRLRESVPDASWSWHPTLLVPDWERYDGPEFPGGRGAVAALCARVSEESGMPIDEYLWFDDPPASSSPACRCVAAAFNRGEVPGRRLLRAAREATFARRRNLDTLDAVVDLARTVPGIDAQSLRDDVDGVTLGPPEGRDPTAVTGVESAGDRPRLPTVVVTGPEGRRGRSGSIDGARLDHVVTAAAGFTPESPSLRVEDVLDRYSAEGWVATAELAGLTGTGYEGAVEAARSLDDVAERSFASEPFFRSNEWVEA